MLFGVVLWYVQSGSYDVYPGISGLTEEFKEFVKGNATILGTPIPFYVFYAIAAAVIVWFIWNKTTLGKKMYAVGANPDAAKASGIPVVKTTILVFMISGMLYGFSGFVQAAYIGSVSHVSGVNGDILAMLACMLGGVSVTGGIGKISGVVIGASLYILLSITMPWLPIHAEMQYIQIGMLLLVAAAINKKRYSATVR